MCIASLEKGYYWTSAKKPTVVASQKKQVRFAMKLPLFNSNTQKVVRGDTANNDDENGGDVSREQDYEDAMTAAAVVRQQAPSEWPGRSSENATFNYGGGGGMRRVQSANASRPGTDQKSSRSHSQEARPSRNVAAPSSEQLPIPQCKNTLLEIARRKSDHTDLRRMYDYATWNMYDRIVSARNKKRINDLENTDDDDDDDDLLTNEEGEKESSSSSSSKNYDKPSPIVTTANTSCNSSFTSSPFQAAIANKGSSGIIKTSGKNKTTATTNKVQASTSTTTNTTASARTSSTQAMSTTSTYQQQATTNTTTYTNATHTKSSLHHKLRSINKAFSSQDTTDSSQGGTTAATESTSAGSEYSSGSSSGCNSPATFPGFMMRSSSSSQRKLSQGSEDDHFIFQLDM